MPARIVHRFCLFVLVCASVYLIYQGARFYFGTGIQRHHLESTWILVAITALAALLFSNRTPDDSIVIRPTPRQAATALAACLAVTTLIYSPGLRIGFLSDDFVLFAMAADNRFIDVRAWEYIRPVPLLVWRLAVPFGAKAPLVLHTFNVLLHGVNSFLVCWLGLRVGLNVRAALAMGLLFALYPAHVEAVVWCSGVQDLLMTFGTLLLCLAVSSPNGGGGIAAAAVGVGVAVFSKETGVVAPVVAVLLLVIAGRVPSRASMITVAGATVVAVGYSVVRLTISPAPEVFQAPLTKYLIKEIAVRPFAALGIPWSAQVLATRPILGLASLTVVVAFVACLCFGCGGYGSVRRVVSANLWVVASILPLFSFFYVSPDLEGARYLYLPAVGWVMFIVISLWCRQIVPRGIAAARYAGILAMLTLGAAGIRWHIDPWIEAARTRDRVLDAALRSLDATTCTAVSFADIPDSWRGAYVLRNGFPEAVQYLAPASRRVLVGENEAPSGCAFRWDGVRFVTQ